MMQLVYGRYSDNSVLLQEYGVYLQSKPQIYTMDTK